MSSEIYRLYEEIRRFGETVARSGWQDEPRPEVTVSLPGRTFRELEWHVGKTLGITGRAAQSDIYDRPEMTISGVTVRVHPLSKN